MEHIKHTSKVAKIHYKQMQFKSINFWYKKCLDLAKLKLLCWKKKTVTKLLSTGRGGVSPRG